MELIKKMHEMYAEDTVTLDMLAAAEAELEDLENDLRDIEQNRLLNFTTFFLDVIEAELGITEKAATFTQRCDEVRGRLLSRGSVSVDGARRICAVYLDDFEVYYYPDSFKFLIVTQNNSARENAALKNVLRGYLPAHIYIDYAAKIRTHGELEDFTHEYLEDFTHDELREKWEL